jgi:DNA-binding NarL/FixJ family response regulator
MPYGFQLFRGQRRRTTVGKALNGSEEDASESTQPTPRQHQIIQLLAAGKINKEVADVLGISVRTAEAHRAQIMMKFHFHSLADLVCYAFREGIASVQGESPRATAAATGQR